MSIQISDITLDPTLLPTDKQSLLKFSALVESILATQVPPGSDWKNLSMFQLCESVGIDLSSLPKEGRMLCALWVIVLRGINKYMPEDQLKYPTLSSFRDAYSEHFERDDETEWTKLQQIANWMHILFALIPAKKNKGLAMLVCPRFVEGWHVKYVTGSGQTHYTANRVKVFEIEGETKAAQRGKLKVKQPKKKSSSGSLNSEDSDAGEEGFPIEDREYSSNSDHKSVSRKRKIKAESSSENTSMDAASSIRRPKKAKSDSSRIPAPPVPGRCTTDVLRSASNEECREAYREFQAAAGLQRDETALQIPDLLRADSWINSAVPNLSLPAPTSVERNITWGEIPVNNSYSGNVLGVGGLSSLSNLGSFSLGSVFMNPGPAMRPEAPDMANIFDPRSPTLTNSSNNPFGSDKLSEVFGSFTVPGYQLASQSSN